MNYLQYKARAVSEAMEWQQTFSDGKTYYWSEMADWYEYFEKLAKRYGLIREFRENGII